MKRNFSKPVYDKNIETLRSEWDQIVKYRHYQISSGEDISFNNVLLPTIKKLLNGIYITKAVDIGCGSGDLTIYLLEYSEKVVGIDFSPCSIRIAKELYSNSINIDFFESSVEEYVNSANEKSFSLAVANMSLMTMPNLREIANAIKNILDLGGILIATIPHPAFWPKYWGYENDNWFNYNSEIAIEAPFRISKETLEFVTTHFHRPLEYYTECFSSVGFVLEHLLEPWPNEDVMSLYPEPWEYPRFLALKWTRIR
jgi:SAM-dependent methyltransferase